MKFLKTVWNVICIIIGLALIALFVWLFLKVKALIGF